MGTMVNILSLCLHSTHTRVMIIVSRMSSDPSRSSRVIFDEVKGHVRWNLAMTVSVLSLSLSWMVA